MEREEPPSSATPTSTSSSSSTLAAFLVAEATKYEAPSLSFPLSLFSTMSQL